MGPIPHGARVEEEVRLGVDADPEVFSGDQAIHLHADLLKGIAGSNPDRDGRTQANIAPFDVVHTFLGAVPDKRLHASCGLQGPSLTFDDDARSPVGAQGPLKEGEIVVGPNTERQPSILRHDHGRRRNCPKVLSVDVHHVSNRQTFKDRRGLFVGGGHVHADTQPRVGLGVQRDLNGKAEVLPSFDAGPCGVDQVDAKRGRRWDAGVAVEDAPKVSNGRRKEGGTPRSLFEEPVHLHTYVVDVPAVFFDPRV
jgi:hypothetical protein